MNSLMSLFVLVRTALRSWVSLRTSKASLRLLHSLHVLEVVIMKKVSLISVLASTLILTSFNSTAVSNTFLEGASSHKEGDTRKGTHQEAYNSGYFNGFVFGVASLDINNICPEGGSVSEKQVRSVVSYYVKTHPQRHHLSDETLTIEALRSAWPCE